MAARTKYLNKFKLKSSWQYILFFFTSLLIRAAGAQLGNPFAYHNDEHWIFFQAFRMVLTESWDPGWYVYPPFLTTLYKLLIIPFMWIHPTNLYIPRGEFWFNPISILPEQFPVLYLGRLLIATFGAATVILVYAILKRITNSTIALIFSLLYCINPMVIQFSMFLRPEPLVIFFLTLTLYFLMNYQATNVFRKKSQWCWAAGIALGFAIGSKYNAFFFFFSILLFIYLHEKNKNTFFMLSTRALMGTVVGFFTSSPQGLWKFQSVVYEIGHNYKVYKHGHAGNAGSSYENIQFYMDYLFSLNGYAYMLPLFALSIILLIAWYKRKFPEKNVLTVSIFFSVSYFLFVTLLFRYRADRVVTLIQPFVFIASGITTFLIVDRLKLKSSAQNAVWLLLGACMLHTAYLSSRFLIKCFIPLPQDNAMNWIYQNAPKGSKILKEFDSPFINPTKYLVGHIFATSLSDPRFIVDLDPNYIILNKFMKHVTNDSNVPEAKEISEWLWSDHVKAEFLDMNPYEMPCSIAIKIINFQNYKDEFANHFLSK